MEDLTKAKAWAWGLGILFVVATSIAGIFFNQVKTERESVKSLTTSQTELQHKLETAEAAKTTAENHATSLAQSYERKIAVLKDGQAVLDGHGMPVFNTESGSMSRSEIESLVRTSYDRQLVEKDERYGLLKIDFDSLKAKTSRPALRPITLALGYQVRSFKAEDIGAGRWWPGLGYNMQLGPWVGTLSALVGLPGPGLDLTWGSVGGMAMMQVIP